jgi:hypothetical protein
VYELDLITDMLEEQLVKGNLRWIGNFNEIYRDYAIGDVAFQIYALGQLQEKGFFLSRIYSALVTPKYKIHLLLYTNQEVNPKLVRKIILACKSKFGRDDWILLCLVQKQPFEKSAKDSITNTADRTVGITAYSLASKETVVSNNVLGKGLAKQLKLTEPKFEAFDLINFLKSFTIVFSLGTLLLITFGILGMIVQSNQMFLALLLMFAFSLIIGHRIYKTRYHMALSLSSRGFEIREGQKVTKGKWSNYTDVTIYITSNLETCLRLHSKEETIDLPLSRVGISRKEAYNTVKQLIGKK